MKTGLRTDSPDNDSAFSDNISMLSSESSASSGASAARTDASKSSGASSTTSNASSSLAVEVDAAARLKAEKIRMALEKMREANVKKLFIKAFTTDGSTKSLLVDEKMAVGHVTRLLADKNHVRMEPKWVLVEHLPDLHMERIYEDHEMLVDQLMLWTRDSRNTLLFVERPEKYALFSRPEDFLLLGSSSEKDRNLDDDARVSLLDEFFSGTGVGVPEIEGPLYLKAEGKKAWKRFYFVLRASGLYYSPKGKSKSSKDLVCLATFEVNQVYTGVNWRKKYKAPSDFGFAIKHPKLQSKSSKFIKYLCAEDERTLAQWMMGIRIAKHGKALMDNYRSLIDELAQEDLDQLANARSFSLVSMATAPTAASSSSPESRANELTDDGTSSSDTPVNTLQRVVSHNNKNLMHNMKNGDTSSSSSSSSSSCSSNSNNNSNNNSSSSINSKECNRTLTRQDSLKSRTSNSSSSGCLSERSSNGTTTPTFEHAFDSDFPMGTIKRKPSMTPKLPLTSTTRLLVKEVEDTVDGEVTDCGNVARNAHRQSFRKSLTEEVNTIRRKTSSASSTVSLTGSGSIELTVRTTMNELQRPTESEATGEPDDLDGLPLPPPPTFGSPVEYLSIGADVLPPPPPEAFENLDDGSPLPLPPAELLVSRPLSPPLPPPPPPPPATCLRSPAVLRSEPSSPTRSPPSPTPPPVPSLKPCLKTSSSTGPKVPPKPVGCFVVRRDSPSAIAAGDGHNGNSIYSNTVGCAAEAKTTPPKSPTKKNRRITFDDRVVLSPPSAAAESPADSPCPARPPCAPKRTEPLRPSLKQSQQQSGPATPPKTVPQKLNSPGCTVTPPRDFLSDLQRVMQKKWQVAQKCKDDVEMTPHEVLGFRDQPPPATSVPATYKENSVRAWVAEHYGSESNSGALQPSVPLVFYPNAFVPSSNILTAPNVETAAANSSAGDLYQNCVELRREYTHPYLPAHKSHTLSARPGSSASSVASDDRLSRTLSSSSTGKRLPPPPPKRSDTTHLSTRIH